MVLAACWSPGKPVSPPPPIEHHDAVAAPAEDRFVAHLTIDAQPSGKKFQGVWLAHGGEKLVVDYRAREFWKSFEGLDVRVTGKRWSPDPRAQAIDAQHFQVARLEVADRTQAKRFFAIGPEREVTGNFVHKLGDPGTKSEGSSPLYFEQTDGTRYEVIGGEDGSGSGTVVVRDVEINPAWAATTGGPFVWILEVR